MTSETKLKWRRVLHVCEHVARVCVYRRRVWALCLGVRVRVPAIARLRVVAFRGEDDVHPMLLLPFLRHSRLCIGIHRYFTYQLTSLRK